jgi:hypothetical protein
MSAGEQPPDAAPPESLTGDFIGIAIVTDYQTDTESEEIVGQTFDEVTISPEYEEAETPYHEEAVTQVRRKHYTLTIEFMMAAISGQPQLQTIGTHDESGNVTGGTGVVEHEAIRVYIYDNEPDFSQSADDAWEFRGCEMSLGEINYAPGDPGEVPVTINVNGGWKHGRTPAPSGTT